MIEADLDGGAAAVGSCRNCGAALLPESAVCEACGWAIVITKPLWQRLRELVGVIAGLALLAGASLGMQFLLGL